MWNPRCMKLRSRCTKGNSPSMGRSGACLTTPVSMSGATSPAPRAMARIMPVMMPGIAHAAATSKNYLRFYDAMYSFFSRPEVVFKG